MYHKSSTRHYTVQGHSRSLMLVPINSPHANYCLWQGGASC